MSQPAASPATPSFALLIGRPFSGKTRLALQLAAAATRCSPYSCPDLPPALAPFLPATPVPVLLLNHRPQLNDLLLSFNPDPTLIYVANLPTLVPQRRRAHPASPDHPLAILASQLADDPPIRLIIIDDLPKLVGHQAPNLIPALLALARTFQVPIIATAAARSRPYPFAPLAHPVHTLPSGRWRHSRPPHSPMRRDNLLTEAIDLFQSQLAAGPQYAELFLDLAVGKHRISTSTIYRAKRALRIESFGPRPFCQWRLPHSGTPTSRALSPIHPLPTDNVPAPRALSPIQTPSVANELTPQRTLSPIHPLPADNFPVPRALSPIQSPSADNVPAPQRTDSPIQPLAVDNDPAPGPIGPSRYAKRCFPVTIPASFSPWIIL